MYIGWDLDNTTARDVKKAILGPSDDGITVMSYRYASTIDHHDPMRDPFFFYSFFHGLSLGLSLMYQLNKDIEITLRYFFTSNGYVTIGTLGVHKPNIFIRSIQFNDSLQ